MGNNDYNRTPPPSQKKTSPPYLHIALCDLYYVRADRNYEENHITILILKIKKKN
jgi:hypothetical protein